MNHGIAHATCEDGVKLTLTVFPCQRPPAANSIFWRPDSPKSYTRKNSEFFKPLTYPESLANRRLVPIVNYVPAFFRAPLGSLWYKYDSVSGKWYDFSGSYKFLNRRNAVQLTIKDGGFGDADGVANGIIVDPAGLFMPEKAK